MKNYINIKINQTTDFFHCKTTWLYIIIEELINCNKLLKRDHVMSAFAKIHDIQFPLSHHNPVSDCALQKCLFWAVSVRSPVA